MSIRWCALFIQYTLEGLLSLLRGKLKSLQVPKWPCMVSLSSYLDLVSPISCCSPLCLSLLYFKQHPLPPALSTLFSLFHCSISPSRALITIWYTMFFFNLFLFILLIIYLPTLDSMKRAVYFFFFFYLQLPEQYLAKQVLRHYFLDWMN